MTDKNDIGETPTSTPRRTLGIRRQTPKSAPLPSRSIAEKPTSALKTADRLMANHSTRSESQHTENENSNATPVISKRKRVPATVDRIKKTKIGKKLKLSPEHSPERARVSTSQNESIANVQNEIEQIKTEIEAMKVHEERKQKLIGSIEEWKVNALEALQDLREKIVPKQSITAILDHLRIPHEMFDIDSLDED